MYTRTVRKTGNSLSVSLPVKYLEKLDIREGDIVIVRTIGDSVYFRKLDKELHGNQGDKHRPDRRAIL